MILLYWFAASAIVTPVVGRMLRSASERSFVTADGEPAVAMAVATVAPEASRTAA